MTNDWRSPDDEEAFSPSLKVPVTSGDSDHDASVVTDHGCGDRFNQNVFDLDRDSAISSSPAIESALLQLMTRKVMEAYRNCPEVLDQVNARIKKSSR